MRTTILSFLPCLAAVAADPAPVLALKFQAYDGSPPGRMDFQINAVNLRQPSEFLTIGSVIRGTKYKISKFTSKAKNGADISELEIVHVVTGRTVTLILDKLIEIPSPDAPDPAKPK